ncbi:elongation factor G [Desulfopila inferna]|uniref:elongation factor G n=1 Tax=Desulfopila inferna TaxID=468528 RepID=UPI0019654470|nr:elongation factor G [Desulfopila inferna]MBM9602929.1 elongation factor G [Desulfopila inferna]
MQDINMVRNIAIVGHGNCGKTSLAEAMLYTAGKINRLGQVDSGTSAMDYEEEEINRNISINNSFHNYIWKKHQVFLIDTPGDDNFLNETLFATKVCDSAVFTIGAVLGVKGQTIKFADFIAERKLPCLLNITKMDRERANFEKAIDEIKAQLPVNPVVIHLPIGAEDNFRGIVDIIRQKAYLFNEGGSGKVTETDIPAEMLDDVEMYRESLMESVAETDDELIEKFLEEGELTKEELLAGLRKAIATSEIAPVTVSAATLNKGTELFLNAIIELMPSPADRPAAEGINPENEEIVSREPSLDEKFSAIVFKTMADPYAGRLTIFRVYSGVLSGDTFYNSSKKTSERFGQLYLLEGKDQKPVDSVGPGSIIAVAKLKETVTGDSLCDPSALIVFPELEPLKPVISFAVSAKQGDEEKLFSSITKMLDEDLTLKLSREQNTGEVLISGVGPIHLEILASKIKRKYGVEMELSRPKVPYKETIKGKARVQGKHKKQSGGRGQYGDCWIEIEPVESGSGLVFEDKIVGGVIPQQYRPAVEKGIQEAMEKGVLAGYPVVDIKASLVDGSFHNVDSSEMAFKIAGSLAFKKGAQEAGLVLLEPIMDITIKVGKDNVGDVMGDLNSRRGKVMGMDSDGKYEIINAQVPMAEIQTYATDLTSMTGGLGSFSIKFSHYEEVPGMIAEKIIAASSQE